MIFLLPLFCRKISSSISRHNAKKTCLKILELSLQVWDVNRTKFCPRQNLENFLFDQSLTIIVDRDFILKIDSQSLPLIFHPGWTRDQKILSRELKNSRIFWICFLSRKEDNKYGKSWSNKSYENIRTKSDFVWKGEFWKNIDQNIITSF